MLHVLISIFAKLLNFKEGRTRLSQGPVAPLPLRNITCCIWEGGGGRIVIMLTSISVDNATVADLIGLTFWKYIEERRGPPVFVR